LPAAAIRNALVCAALLACVSLCLGWADTWDDIRRTAGTVTSVQTDFTQTKQLPILTHPLVSKGRLYYQQPGSLRWEYLTPIHSILVMHDGRVRRFTEDTRTHAFREESGAGLDAMQVVFEEISQWMGGRFEDNPMFDARLEPPRKIVLTPKQPSFAKILQRIELFLDEQPGVIREVLIVEDENAFSKLSFSGTVINQTINADLFRNAP